MDLRLSTDEAALVERAREFTERHLYPLELDVEMNDGLSREQHQTLNKAILAYRFNATRSRKEDGGQGMTLFENMLLHEEFGKATGNLWYAIWQPAPPLQHGTPEQRRDYLLPCIAGERFDAYAVTEPEAGSDPRRIRTTAIRRGGKYVINGEKWFVSKGDIADFLIVLTLLDKSSPGVRVKRTPKFTHSFAFGHPEFLFEDVEVDESKLIGGVGQGLEITKDWFVHARIVIGAHCVGAATRALELANDFAAGRIQFDRPIRDFQAIEFMLADMAVQVMAAKSMLYRVCWEITEKNSRVLAHAQASAVKLYCSEMAGRVLDSAVQIFGGRGYMRENPVERLWREMRVERIWEGTSEIQRMIIGGQIKKRGTKTYTGWIEG